MRSGAQPPIGSTWHLGSVSEPRPPVGPSLHDLRQKLPSFVRSLPQYYGLIRLLIRVHARRTAIAFPSRPGTSPGTDEPSQVPHKELLHVRKVSDCARFSPCKPIRHGRCCLLSTERDRHLGIRPVSQLNTRPVVSPVNASRLPSRAEPRASLGVGWLARPSPWGTFTSYSLPAFLAHSESGQYRKSPAR